MTDFSDFGLFRLIGMRERRAVRGLWLRNFIVLFAKKYLSPLTPLVKYSTVVKAHFDVGCVKGFAEKYFLPRISTFGEKLFFKKKYYLPSSPLKIQHSK